MTKRLIPAMLYLVFATTIAHADQPAAVPTSAPPPPPASAPPWTATPQPGGPTYYFPPAEQPVASLDPDELVERSHARKVTGIALTIVGIVHMVAGGATMIGFASASGGEGLGVLLGLIIGGPILGTGVVLTGVGIPLWVTGAQMVPASEVAATEPWVPRVDIGPGAGSLTWTF